MDATVGVKELGLIYMRVFSILFPRIKIMNELKMVFYMYALNNFQSVNAFFVK